MDHPLPWLRYVDAKDLENKENGVKLAVQSSQSRQIAERSHL